MIEGTLLLIELCLLYLLLRGVWRVSKGAKPAEALGLFAYDDSADSPPVSKKNA